jgi:3-hydroxyacyl-CoA dehydrogenase
VAEALISKGALGQKTRAGIYRKEGKAIHVLDLASRTTARAPARSPEVAEILKLRNPAEKFEKLRAQPSSAGAVPVVHLPRRLPLLRGASRSIADNARDVDLAMRWGFGWARGRSRPGRPPAGGHRE